MTPRSGPILFKLSNAATKGEGGGARRVEGSPSPSPSPEVEVLELSSSFSSEWTPAAREALKQRVLHDLKLAG